VIKGVNEIPAHFAIRRDSANGLEHRFIEPRPQPVLSQSLRRRFSYGRVLDPVVEEYVEVAAWDDIATDT
jgi:hypothetical protein